MFFVLRAAPLALNTLLHDSLHKLPTISQDTVRFVVAVTVVVVLAVGYSVTDDPGGRCYLICQICWPCPVIKAPGPRHIINYDVKT